MYNIFDRDDIFDLDMDVWNDGEENNMFISFLVGEYIEEMFFFIIERYVVVEVDWRMVSLLIIYYLYFLDI